MKMLLLMIVAFTVLLSIPLLAHPGGKIKSGDFEGCHSQTSDDSFHCHTKGDDSAKEPKSSTYDRATWGNWNDPDLDCRDTRTEILLRDNLGDPTFNKGGCSLTAGRWTDFYSDEVLLSPDKIEIDHVVSLKHAHDSGGKEWTEQKKNKFYNDPDNLVAASITTNRTKGANDFRTWLPSNKARACEYAQRWLKVKRKYLLTISAPEIKSFNLLECALKLKAIEKSPPPAE